MGGTIEKIEFLKSAGCTRIPSDPLALDHLYQFAKQGYTGTIKTKALKYGLFPMFTCHSIIREWEDITCPIILGMGCSLVYHKDNQKHFRTINNMLYAASEAVCNNYFDNKKLRNEALRGDTSNFLRNRAYHGL